MNGQKNMYGQKGGFTDRWFLQTMGPDTFFFLFRNRHILLEGGGGCGVRPAEPHADARRNERSLQAIAADWGRLGAEVKGLGRRWRWRRSRCEQTHSCRAPPFISDECSLPTTTPEFPGVFDEAARQGLKNAGLSNTEVNRRIFRLLRGSKRS